MLYDSLGFPHVQEVGLIAKFQSLPDPGGQEVPEFFWVTFGSYLGVGEPTKRDWLFLSLCTLGVAGITRSAGVHKTKKSGHTDRGRGMTGGNPKLLRTAVWSHLALACSPVCADTPEGTAGLRTAR